MEALRELDHVSIPDSMRPPSKPSVVTAVAATSEETGSDGCDPCPLPPAANPLPAPDADDTPKISALDRDLTQAIHLSRPHGSLVLVLVLVLVLWTLAWSRTRLRARSTPRTPLPTRVTPCRSLVRARALLLVPLLRSIPP